MPSSPASPWRIAAALVALAAALLAAVPASAAGPSAGAERTWAPIGAAGAAPPTVTAAAVRGTRLYLAGNIGALGRMTGPLARFDPASGAATSAPLLGRTSGTKKWRVTAIAPDQTGGYYVAGGFEGAGDGTTNVAQANLLHVTSAGRIDPGFAPVVPAGAANEPSVDALAVAADGSLVVGGSFTSIGGQNRTGLAVLNGQTGATRTAFNAQLDGRVRDIEPAGGDVYVAGEFTTVRGTPRAGVAKVSLATGAPVTAWDARVMDGSVAGATPTLELAGSQLYIGGFFAPPTPGAPTVGTASLSHLARVNLTTGAADAGWAPDPDGAVFDIAADGDRVLVGGEFSSIGEQVGQAAIHGAAAVDATTGVADATWDPGVPATAAIGRILRVGDTVYLGSGPEAGNRFTAIQGVSRCTLAAVSAPDGSTPAVRAWAPQPAFDGTAVCGSFTKTYAMEAIGGDVVVGGDFQFANLQPRRGLAALDLATGDPLPWAPFTNAAAGSYGNVRDLEVSADGATVYVAGSFTQFNGAGPGRLAAVAADGAADTAAAVRAGWPALNGDVRALELSADGATLYVGGLFSTVAATSRSRLAALDAATGALQPAAFAAPNAGVYDLERSPEGTLFASGAFVTAGGATRNHVAEYAADGTLQPFDAGLPATAEVEDVAFSGDAVIVAGAFTGTIGGAARTNVVALRRGDATATAWNPAPDREVRRVSVAPDGTIYLTGPFTTLGGVRQPGAAAVDPAGAAVAAWRPAAINVPLDANRSVPEVLFAGDRVIVGGAFTDVSGRPQGGIAVFGPAVAPGAAGAPVITGTPDIGRPLTCATGRWSGSAPFVREIAWLRAGEPIPGATTAGYVVSDEDSGLALSCRERVLNMAGEAVQTSAEVSTALRPPAADVAPVVAGEPYAGRTAICSTGIWLNRPTGFTYRWLLDGAAVPGATARTFALAGDARGRMLGCEVVAANAAGPSAAARSLDVRVTQPPPRALGAPQILGGDTTGLVLACDPGPWEQTASFAFQWLRDGAAIAGASADRYRTITADAAHVLSCRVTGINQDHSTVAASAALRIRGGASTQQRGRNAPPEGADDDRPPKKLAVGRVRMAKGGRVAVTLRAPKAGRLTVAARSTGKGKARTLGSDRARLKRAATLTLRFKLKPSARKAVRRDALPVRIEAELAPPTGKPLKASARATLRRAR